MKKIVAITTVMFFTSKGFTQNTGIGTSTPQAKLHISSSVSEALRLDAPHPMLSFHNNGSPTDFIQSEASSFSINTNFLRPVYINPGGNFTASFSWDGKVGIQTPVPLTKLNVTGGNYDLTNSYGDFLIGSSSYSLRMGISTEASPIVPGRAFIVSSGAGGAGGKLYLGLDNNTTLLSLQSNSVGIGLNLTNPEAKLHVLSNNANSFSPTLLLDDINPFLVMRGQQNSGKIYVNGFSFNMETTFGNIFFRPNGNTVMTVQSGTFVGIGTGSPAVTLDVFKDADVWHSFIGGATGRIQIGGQTGNGSVIQSYNPTTNNVRDLYLQRDGGNVGIGNTNPTVRLQVSGAEQLDFVSGASPHLLLNQSDAGYARLGFKNSNGRSWTVAGIRTGSAATDQLNFFNEQSNADRFILYGNGNATLAGTLTQNSDARLKKNIAVLNNVLPSVMQISGYTYNWKDQSRGTETQIGLLAQEVENVFPQLVREDDKGNKSVAYQNLVPILLQAIKEQQVQIEQLKKQIHLNQ